MKNKYFFFFLSLFFFQACQPQHPESPAGQTKPDMEHFLVRAVVIEGEDIEYMSLGDRMRYYNVPGVSIAYIDSGRLQWSRGYGYTGFDTGRPVDEYTLFQAASISKPVAALMALRLVEEGKLSLDSNVNNYLREWKVEENEYTARYPVTLRGLLTHTAGLTVHGFRGYAAGEDVPDIIQVLSGEAPANSDPIRPDTVPGSISRYSGGGYTVMQKMLEDVTGAAFEDLLQKQVLDVIGMENSSYEQPLPEDRHRQASIGHRPDGKQVEGRWHTYPEMAAAGLWTTPTDLAKYMMEVQLSYQGLSNRILSQEMTREMLTKQADNQGLGPGLSESADTLSFGHGGANEGYRCQIFAYAASGPGVAVMTNSDNGGGLVQEIIRGLSYYYNWPTYKAATRTRITIDPEDLKKFTGRYRMDREYRLKISLEEGQLWVHQQWDKLEYPLVPSGELLFFVMDDNAEFEFERDETGKVTGFLVMGQYRFAKQ